MGKLVETRLQKIIFLMGGVFISWRLIGVESWNIPPVLIQALAIAILILTLLVFLRDYTARFYWMRKHKRIIVIIVIILAVFALIFLGLIWISKQRFRKAEISYQNCLDKVAQTSHWVKPPPSPCQPGDQFCGVFDNLLHQQNEYFDAWVSNDRPYYNQGKGYWEVAFMKWMMKNRADYCKEYQPSEILFFLERKVVDR